MPTGRACWIGLAAPGFENCLAGEGRASCPHHTVGSAHAHMQHIALGGSGQTALSDSIQPVLLNPTLRDSAKTQQPIVEATQAPAAACHQALPQALIFEASQPIAHRHPWLACVPIDLRFGSSFGETKMFAQVPLRLWIGVLAGLE